LREVSAIALKSLIFDVDGTLADTEELHRRAFNDSFAEAGLGWVWDADLYGRLLAVTGGKERIRYFIDRFGGRPDLPADEIAALHTVKTARYKHLVTDGALRLRPGIERLLREARSAGIRLAIATTTTPANVAALLSATLGPDGAGWFDVIAAGDEVAAKKPAPDIYHLALQRLGLNAADCIAFEDTPNGVISARSAGIATVASISSYGGSGPFPGAMAVVDHLGDTDMPCTVLSGPLTEKGIVDIATLIRWHREATLTDRLSGEGWRAPHDRG
jgi:HAD superfamily hydrolase (TIGR01509 family)